MTNFANTVLNPAGIANDAIIPDRLILDEHTRTSPFGVTASTGPYVRGEVVTLVLATGIINKLTAPPAAGDVLAVVAYGFDNSAAAVSAGTASSSAQVYVAGRLNETALVFNGTATLANCRQALQGSGIQLQVPLAFN